MKGIRGNTGRRRWTTAWAFLVDPAFDLGVADFLAAAPLRDFADRGTAWRYEAGRLFAAHCIAELCVVPTLPRRDQRQASFDWTRNSFTAACGEGAIPPARPGR